MERENLTQGWTLSSASLPLVSSNRDLDRYSRNMSTILFLPGTWQMWSTSCKSAETAEPQLCSLLVTLLRIFLLSESMNYQTNIFTVMRSYFMVLLPPMWKLRYRGNLFHTNPVTWCHPTIGNSSYVFFSFNSLSLGPKTVSWSIVHWESVFWQCWRKQARLEW